MNLIASAIALLGDNVLSQVSHGNLAYWILVLIYDNESVDTGGLQPLDNQVNGRIRETKDEWILVNR